MKKLFLSLGLLLGISAMLLLATQVAFGMEEQKMKFEMLKIESMMYEHSERAYLESAALALNESLNDVRKRSRFSESKIAEIFYDKYDHYITYSTNCGDGEIIGTYFIEGPMAGKHVCVKNVLLSNGVYASIPMHSSVCDRLRYLYEVQNK